MEIILSNLILSILVLVSFTIILLFTVDRYISKVGNGAKVIHKKRSLETLIDVLHFTIEKEIVFRLKIEKDIKQSSKIITDYANELRGLSHNVFNALSPDYLDELSYYYKKEYITKYIVKSIEIFIIKYMTENQITSK